MLYDAGAIVSLLSGVRSEDDGSYTADCPKCEEEGEGKGRGKLKVFANGQIVCRRYSGTGRQESLKHIADIYTLKGLDPPQDSFINHTMLDGRLTIEIQRAAHNKQRLTARNCNEVLHLNTISLDSAKDRKAFVADIPGLDDDERRKVEHALVQLADQYSRAYASTDDEEEPRLEKAAFVVCDDGRIAEVTTRGYVVYDPHGQSTDYLRQVESDGVIYTPPIQELQSAGIGLPTGFAEYNTDAELDASIEAYLERWIDMPRLERRMTATYIRLTYLADKLFELPYIRILGASGNGKSRAVVVIGLACYRPYIVIDPSASSLFRLLDAYHPTVAIDECNFRNDSDDFNELIKVLNAGYQRVGGVSRVERTEDGFEPRIYDPFGPKIIASLKSTDSQAFESRCIKLNMQQTTRKDIPLRLSERLMRDAESIRNRLTLWRLRNWKKDIEAAMEEAEIELKGQELMPRLIQISIPLYALLASDETKRQFIAMLKERDSDAAEERKSSFDGELVRAIHQCLFEIDDEGKAVWLDTVDRENCIDGEPCEYLLISDIADLLNEDRGEQDKKLNNRWVGKRIRSLELQTREITNRKSHSRKKSAVVFNRKWLAHLFNLYCPALPPDFHPANPATSHNSSEINGLSWPDQIFFHPASDPVAGSNIFSSGQDNRKEIKDLRKVAGLAGSNPGDKQAELKKSPSEEAEPGADDLLEDGEAPLSGLVALDTETEPFDKKRGVTPRNARMIGLALCYDGQRADYETDAAAWPLLMPEPEQTVIFHNAKFDLGVLERACLPLPDRWEDTIIAAHLLDENGEHGLKPLAKSHLSVADPLTFEEADRLRLLDPDVFNEYARNDSRYTYRLWEKFKPELDREGLSVVYEMEKALVPVVLDMERCGMRIDLDLLNPLGREVDSEIERIRAEVFEHAGCRFDLNSNQKVAAILYDKLGIPSKKITNKGQRSVDREALEDVRGYHPAVDALLRYREIDKLSSTFLKVLPGFADESGRIHPEFRPLGAKTGRFSCSEPNVQQMPARSELGKRLRSAFIAEEGCKLVVADWSQMELRVLAHYSRDPLLVEAYTAEMETDLHSLTASRMFRKPIEEVEKSERTVAKMINFGIAYGITPTGLFNRLKPAGMDVTEEECSRFIENYFSTYPGVKEFLSKASQAVRRRGYVKNLYGRRRRLKGRTARQIRQAQNFIIQATAADLAKDAMVRLYRLLPEGAHIIAQVHDEFIIECPALLAEYARGLIVEVMTQAPEGFTIPLKVDVNVVDNWGEAK